LPLPRYGKCSGLDEFGLEYAVHADLIAVLQCGAAPSEDVDGTAAAGVLQFERCVVVAAMRGGLLHPEGRALQRDVLVIEVRKLLDNQTDGNISAPFAATDVSSPKVVAPTSNRALQQRIVSPPKLPSPLADGISAYFAASRQQVHKHVNAASTLADSGLLTDHGLGHYIMRSLWQKTVQLLQRKAAENLKPSHHFNASLDRSDGAIEPPSAKRRVSETCNHHHLTGPDARLGDVAV
jgi:hypothetical protein